MSQSHVLLGLSLKLGQIFLKPQAIEQVLTDCCQTLTQTSLFNTAWIGLLSADEIRFNPVYFDQQSVPAVYHGHSHDSFHSYILGAPVKSLGFANRCIQKNHHIILDPRKDKMSSEAPWHRYFSDKQNSLIALPIRLQSSSKPLGCLIVTSESENQFNNEVLTFLDNIACDIAHVVSICEEHSDKKGVETLLENERLLLKSLINSIPDLVFYKDLNGVYQGINRAFESFCGKTEEQVLGTTDHDLFDQEAAEFFREQDQKMLDSKTSRSNEEWVVYPDGTKVLLDTLKTPLLDSNDQVMGLIGISRDITERFRINAKLTASEERLQKVLSGASLGYWDWNYQTSHYEVSQQWLSILGLEPVDCLQDISDWEDRIFEEDKEHVIELIANAIHDKQTFHVECRMKHQSGYWVWVEYAGSVVEWEEHGQALRLCGTLNDISQRKRAEELMSENEQRFRELLDSLPNIAVQGYDENRNVIYWNKASEKLYGYLKDEIGDKRLEELIIPAEMQSEVIEAVHQWHEHGIAIPSGELLLTNKTGDMKPVYSSHVMLRNPSGDSEMFCVDIDLTEQKAAQEKLEKMAKFDQLTQLPNRSLFVERFEQALNETKRFDKVIALLFMDLDNFKYINDTFGHEAGDALLIQVSKRLSQSLREYDLISRFSGDEFVIALPHLDNERLITPLVKKIISAFDRPFELQGQSIYISSSIGISFYPDSGDDINNLLKYADMAMYKAKKAGRNRFHFFNEDINEQANRNVNISEALNKAFDNNEFSVLYQPILERSSGEIIACEALIRWHSHQLGDMKPGEFIPVAEQSYHINQIDYWVLEKIQADIKNQIDSGKLPVRIFANFSERVFSDNNFLSKLEELAKNKQLISRYLGIELTEAVLLKAGEKPNQLLQLLHENGISLSLDKFGQGYSSMSYLKQSPIDWLKIDRELIESAAMEGHEAPYVNAIIAMAANLNINVVAMAVETIEQKQFIEQTQCHIVQGFYYHEPMDAESLKQLLKSG